MRISSWLGSVIHNCIAHPLMPFLPRTWGDRFHDWTIEKFWPPLDEDEG
jgi:hypothetical protein